jgi:uncharacterized protein YjdB|tara:strand:+ start:401 stop:892 length:492 start_codon:yes stop_codon:yes gene_type:complete
VTFQALDDTYQLSVTVRDGDGQVINDAPVTWNTSHQVIATVSPTGLVTAVDNGVAAITATSGFASATAAVVIRQEAKSIELSSNVLTFSTFGDTKQLSVEGVDVNGNKWNWGGHVIWMTSDSTIATVSPTGLVTAVANGIATITASSESFSATAVVTVFQVGL